MNPLDRLKNLHRERFVKSQEAIAEEVAKQEQIERQKHIQEGMTATFETIDLANELAKDGDPYKRELAERIKKAVTRTGAPLVEPSSLQGGRDGLEAPPFSDSSPDSSTLSATSLPGSTPKGLPQEPEKRPPGRPRKDGRPPQRRKGD